MSYGTVQAEKVTTESGYSLGAGNASSFKNRLINGAMIFDQRNGGASNTVVNDTYYLDRWQTPLSSGLTGALTIQQSTTAPTGFKNSVLLTSTAASTVGASDYALFWQKIEGLNIYDLAWGTSSAKSVTLSFWVRSSLTGTFGGSVENYDQSRAFPWSYTINSANTWEQKTVTITGDTSGTWLTTNGIGLNLMFSLACGTSLAGTPNSWVGAQKLGATGQTNLVATSGATLYITGVQLEVGTVATSFDFRSYGTELALCQRYFEVFPHTTSYNTIGGTGMGTGTFIYTSISFVVPKRTSPTGSLIGTINAAAFGTNGTSYNIGAPDEFYQPNPYLSRVRWTASLPGAGPVQIQFGVYSSYAALTFSAEL